jgi:hypothetical protein
VVTSSLDGANDTLTVECDGDQRFGGRVDDGSVDDIKRTSTTLVRSVERWTTTASGACRSIRVDNEAGLVIVAD